MPEWFNAHHPIFRKPILVNLSMIREFLPTSRLRGARLFARPLQPLVGRSRMRGRKNSLKNQMIGV